MKSKSAKRSKGECADYVIVYLTQLDGRLLFLLFCIFLLMLLLLLLFKKENRAIEESVFFAKDEKEIRGIFKHFFVVALNALWPIRNPQQVGDEISFRLIPCIIIIIIIIFVFVLCNFLKYRDNFYKKHHCGFLWEKNFFFSKYLFY